MLSVYLCPCLVTCSLKVSSNQLSLQYAQDASDSVEAELAQKVMAIYQLRNQGEGGATDVGIVIEGITVLKDLGDVSRACCYLLGLTYVLT